MSNIRCCSLLTQRLGAVDIEKYPLCETQQLPRYGTVRGELLTANFPTQEMEVAADRDFRPAFLAELYRHWDELVGDAHFPPPARGPEPSLKVVFLQ